MSKKKQLMNGGDKPVTCFACLHTKLPYQMRCLMGMQALIVMYTKSNNKEFLTRKWIKITTGIVKMIQIYLHAQLEIF